MLPSYMRVLLVRSYFSSRTIRVYWKIVTVYTLDGEPLRCIRIGFNTIREKEYNSRGLGVTGNSKNTVVYVSKYQLWVSTYFLGHQPGCRHLLSRVTAVVASSFREAKTSPPSEWTCVVVLARSLSFMRREINAKVWRGVSRSVVQSTATHWQPQRHC